MSRGVPYANVKDRQRETIASKKPLEYRWNIAGITATIKIGRRPKWRITIRHKSDLPQA